MRMTMAVDVTVAVVVTVVIAGSGDGRRFETMVDGALRFRRAASIGEQEGRCDDKAQTGGRKSQDSEIAESGKARPYRERDQNRTCDGYDLVEKRAGHPLGKFQCRQAGDQKRSHSAMDRACYRSEDTKPILPLAHGTKSDRFTKRG